MTDWIMIMITAVYVIATIVICYYNAQAVKTAKKQTEELVFQREQMDRPYISVHFEIIRSGLMCFIIENKGNQPAFDTKIKLNEAFIQNINGQSEKEHLQLLNESCVFFASKQKSVIFIDSQIQFNVVAKEKAVFQISYNHKYEEKIEIDISQYAWMLVYTSPTEDISQHIKEIKGNQEKFQKELLRQLNNDHTGIPLNVVVHSASERDSLKLKVLKVVCINVRSSLKLIAEQADLSLEDTHDLLVELLCVDRLVKTYGGQDWTEIREDMLWFKA